MPQPLTETIVDVVAIVGLTVVAYGAMQTGFGTEVLLTVIYAIAGLGGYSLKRRGGNQS